MMDSISYGNMVARDFQKALTEERAQSSIYRANIAALTATLQRIAETHPKLVEEALQQCFETAFTARSAEVGMPQLFREGASAIPKYSAASKANTVKKVFRR